MTSFHPCWDEIYGNGQQLNRYPWDSVVSFLFRHRPRQKAPAATRILEVGCGFGSNLWFAAREGFQVTGIDGSAHVIELAKARFAAESLEADLRSGDFSSLPFPGAAFDMAIDRASLTCVGLSVAQKAIAEIWRVLLPGGVLFCNVYSDAHTSRSSGVSMGDGLTANIAGGSLSGIGQLCFYSRESLLDQFPADKWRIEALEHVTIDYLVPAALGVHGEWRLIATRI